MKPFVERGGLWVVAQGVVLVIGIAIPVLLRDLLPWPEAGSDVRMGIGGVIAFLGFVLIGFGAASLGAGLTPLPSPNGATGLKTGGVFGLVRHPIYGGVILTYAGYGLGAHTVLGLLAPAMMLLFFDRKASFEERLLEREFPDYPEYRRKARKLIPWLY